MKCAIANCEDGAKTKGLCSGHYHRLTRYGDPEYAPPPRPVSVCSVDGCDSTIGRTGGKGYCRKHYARFRSHGDPLAGGIDYGSANAFVRDSAQKTDVEECVIWPYGKNSEGRGRVNISGKPTNADVAVLRAAKGDKPTLKHECCHLCGNGHLGCVNPSHMYWGTRKENVADAIAHGTAKFFEGVTRHGEKSPVAKYSDAMIGGIRASLAAGNRQVDVAKEFGVSQAHVSRIKLGQSRSSPPANDNNEQGRAVA